MTAPQLSRMARAAAALAALCFSLAAAPAHAGRTVGVGLGSSTLSSGVSVKWQAKGGGGMQLVAGPFGNGLYYNGYGNSLGVNLDGLRDMGEIGNLGPIGVGWSLGGGGGVAVGGTLAAAAAGVAGLNFELEPVPLEFSLEYRPTLIILPGVGFDLVNASGHLRWWF
ncbi:MAG: hypothetical protein JNM72_00555 [Deltaproteobacteria bacterium]|nr:hypothetical protein [Deltaproteobacteria bacterium]